MTKKYFFVFLIDMKISFNTPANKISPTFKSISGYYVRDNKKEMGYYTWFFRKDLDWINFADYCIDHFHSKGKVNIIHFGSSDGTEAYTHTLSLLGNSAGVNVDNFFPIRAFDIKDSIVNMSNSGYININSNEKSVLDKNCPQWREYFTPSFQGEIYSEIPISYYMLQGTPQSYSVSSEIKDKVIFRQGDMFDIVPKIKDKSNTIVFCRNCLSYFSVSEVKGFIRNLRDVLEKDSLFCVGNLEKEDLYIYELLKHSGFKKVMNNVFKKC